MDIHGVHLLCEEAVPVRVGPVLSVNDESDTTLGRMRLHRSYKGTMCRHRRLVGRIASNFSAGLPFSA